MSNVYAVIMAGGVGSRFWPRSRERSPKQLLDIMGAESMIQSTVGRLRAFVDDQHVLVVTNALQREMVQRQLPAVPPTNILVEPVGRNTAPCIALAAQRIRREDPEAVMLVLPADHLITNVREFHRILQTAVRVAEETGALLTIGIKPSHPETGYGYIQYTEENGSANPYRSEGVFRVKTFAEKPNLETAQRFLESGDFLWNSGMFVWKVSAIREEISAHLPEIAEHMEAVERAFGTPEYTSQLEKAYGMMRGISIDYGVMEKAKRVFVVKGDFGWSDVGSWDEAARLATPNEEENVVLGKAFLKDSRRNYINAGRRFVAALGVDDLIVVDTEDALLICRKGRSQDVKEVVDYLRRKHISELL